MAFSSTSWFSMGESRIPSSTSSSSTIRIAVRCARVLAFSFIFLLTLEVATRVEQRIKYGAPLLSQYTYNTVLYTVDDYGIRGQSNATFEKWHLNSLGFRGPEFNLGKSPGKLRIVCIGASETFGLYEQAGNEWPRQLERFLHEQGIDAEIINAALAGMSLPQRLIHFQNRLVELQPDIVILMLEYTSYAGLTPAKIETRRIARTVPPLVRHDKEGEGIKSLRLATAMQYSLIPKLPQGLQNLYHGLNLHYKLRQRRQELGTEFRSFHEVSDLEIKTFKEDLKQFQNVTAQYGIQLLLASPALWLSERNILLFYTSWPYVDENWLRQAIAIFPRVAMEMAEQSNLPFIDLARVVANGESILMKDMVHYSDEGAKVVGHAFATIVEKIFPMNSHISFESSRQP